MSTPDHVTLAHEVAAAAANAGADTAAVVEAVLGALRDVGALREESIPTSSISDGHHTFAELYQFRALLHAHAVRDWLSKGYPVTRSWRHHDGQECFGGGWFVIVAQLPTGQVSNHYPARDWNLFATTPEADLAPVWDGHDAPEVIRRLRAALTLEDEPSQVKSSDAVRGGSVVAI